MGSKAEFDKIPSVDIDESGIYKYVLIELSAKNESGNTINKLLVRGYARCEWHADIYKPFQRSLEPKGLVTYCRGGGWIEHRSDLKKIKIYSYSQAYGQADHNESRKVLLTKYPDYEINCSDD